MNRYMEIIGAGLLVLVLCLCAAKCGSEVPCKPTENDRGTAEETVTRVDTVAHYVTVARSEVCVGTRVELLPIVTGGFRKTGEAGWRPDSVTEEGKRGPDGATSPLSHVLAGDSAWVEVPVTQREYMAEDYHAWVSGYEPSLDSIYVFPRRDVVTIREPPDKPRRWGIGVFAGYGVTPQGLQPCAGISINYNLWDF